jgi:hypothetical protein
LSSSLVYARFFLSRDKVRHIVERAHSYVRHGTSWLFAALDVGFGIGKCYKRHRAAEFLNFLKETEVQVAEGLDIVMNNYATHKMSKIKR